MKTAGAFRSNSTKFVILISSKHTGEVTHLGVSFGTRDEADAWAQANVCQRCNRYSIRPVSINWQWQNRRVGFAAAESVQ